MDPSPHRRNPTHRSLDPSRHRRNRIDRLTDYKIYDAFNLPADALCNPLPGGIANYPSLFPPPDGVSEEELKPGYDALFEGRASPWKIVYYPPGHPERRLMDKIRKSRDDQDQYDGRLAKMRKYREEDQYDGAATKVVLLARMLSSDDHIEDDHFYQNFLQDVTNSARKYGNLVRVVIPRPSPGAAPVVAGVGRVFLEYSLLESSTLCRRKMHRSWWAEKRIVAEFYPEDKFAAGDYGYEGGDCPQID